MELLRKLVKEEKGQGIVEYALIIGLVVFGIWLLVSQTGIGESVENIFININSTLQDPTGGGS